MNGKSENNVTAREAAHFRQGQLVHGGNVLANRSTKYLHTRSTMSLVPTVYYANLRPTFSLSLSYFFLSSSASTLFPKIYRRTCTLNVRRLVFISIICMFRGGK